MANVYFVLTVVEIARTRRGISVFGDDGLDAFEDDVAHDLLGLVVAADVGDDVEGLLDQAIDHHGQTHNFIVAALLLKFLV